MEMAGKSIDLSAVVLMHPANKIVGHARVENASSVRNDIDVVAMVPHRLTTLPLDYK